MAEINPNNGINYLSTGAGFLPSTVSMEFLGVQVLPCINPPSVAIDLILVYSQRFEDTSCVTEVFFIKNKDEQEKKRWL